MSDQLRPEVVGAAEAVDLQRRAAAWLLRSGAGPGDRIGVCVPGSAAQLALIGGALRAGVVPVVVNPLLTASERSVIATGCRAMAWLDDAAAVHRALSEEPVPPGGISPVPLDHSEVEAVARARRAELVKLVGAFIEAAGGAG